MNPGKTKKVLLISNTVMHYRVSVYNYFWRQFRRQGWEFSVITNRLEPCNPIPPRFAIEEIPFGFSLYRQAILRHQPDVVILFLHFKDRMFVPLAHWLKWRKISVAFWTKTRNLDESESLLRRWMFNYMMRLHDGLILYSANLLPNVPRSARHKAFPANNTINFEDFPAIDESRQEIKKQLGVPFGKVVLFAGRMDVNAGRKKVDHLIEIFREVGNRDVGLVIVGSGMKPEWQARMNPRTTLHLGEVHDSENRQISRIFKMADVCAIPGHVGLGLNQAFYFGLPVVTEAGNHPPEIGYLKPGRNGYIVPENDLVALKARIFELLDNDSLREEFSRNAKSDILAEASTEGMFHGFHSCVQFISETLSDGRRANLDLLEKV